MPPSRASRADIEPCRATEDDDHAPDYGAARRGAVATVVSTALFAARERRLDVHTQSENDSAPK